jgi:hypothetical protein
VLNHSANWCETHPEYLAPYLRFRFLGIGTEPSPSRDSEQLSDIADTFHWLIRRGQTSGEINDDLNPARLTIAFHHLYLGAMLRWLADPRLKLRKEFAAAVELFLHGVAVPAKGGGFNDTTRALAKIANENAESWLRTIIEAGEGCDAILVAGLAAFVGFSAAENLGAKGIGSGMIPITPTAAFPSPFLPPKWVPRLLNRASHRFVNAMLWKAFRDKTNAARAMFKLPPRAVPSRLERHRSEGTSGQLSLHR